MNLNNTQEKVQKEQKYLKTVSGFEKRNSKKIENEQKNKEDRHLKVAERLKRGRMRGKRLMQEKEDEKTEAKINMKRRIKAFEEAFAAKGNKTFNKIYLE